MKYWTRTTHNFNNETREWEYRFDYEEDTKIAAIQFKSLGAHALESGRWSNLNEIIGENYHYRDCYTDWAYPGKEIILYELEELEKLGLVKSKDS